MKMFLLNNIKRNKPTYIVSCDIKSAYDNVDQEQLFRYFQENILNKIDKVNQAGVQEDQEELSHEIQEEQESYIHRNHARDQ